jgi:hypothetical protein
MLFTIEFEGQCKNMVNIQVKKYFVSFDRHANNLTFGREKVNLVLNRMLKMSGNSKKTVHLK